MKTSRGRVGLVFQVLAALVFVGLVALAMELAVRQGGTRQHGPVTDTTLAPEPLESPGVGRFMITTSVRDLATDRGVSEVDPPKIDSVLSFETSYGPRRGDEPPPDLLIASQDRRGDRLYVRFELRRDGREIGAHDVHVPTTLDRARVRFLDRASDASPLPLPQAGHSVSLPLGGQPSGSVRVEGRLVAEVLSVQVTGRRAQADSWNNQFLANPGDRVSYLIRFKNEGNTLLTNVAVGNNLPPRVAQIPRTTMIRNSNHPDGSSVDSDNIASGGINVGNYLPGAVGYVTFDALIDNDLGPGIHKLQNVGVVRADGMNELFNVAAMIVDVPGVLGVTRSAANVAVLVIGFAAIMGAYLLLLREIVKRGAFWSLKNVGLVSIPVVTAGLIQTFLPHPLLAQASTLLAVVAPSVLRDRLVELRYRRRSSSPPDRDNRDDASLMA